MTNLSNLPPNVRAIMTEMNCDAQMASWLLEQEREGKIAFKFSLCPAKVLTEEEKAQQSFARAVRTLANIGSWCMLVIEGQDPPITAAKKEMVRAAKVISYQKMMDCTSTEELRKALVQLNVQHLNQLKSLDVDLIE